MFQLPDARTSALVVGALRKTRISARWMARMALLPPGLVEDHGGDLGNRRLDLIGERRSRLEPVTANTTTRRGSCSRARASSIASARPSACVDGEPRSWAGSGSRLASKRQIVPSSAPERIVSTTKTALRPDQASISPAGSPCCARTSIPASAARPRSRLATSMPAPSSPRRSLPRPMTSTGRASGSVTVDGELEEVRRARDAGVVVSDRLFAAERQLLVAQVQVMRDHRS